MKIGIVGAGATGMATAWYLVKAGHEVTLYEAGSEVGGLAAGFRDENWDWTLEKFYHHWFMTDNYILDFIKEIGHSDKILFPRPKTSYWINGKIYRSEISPAALLLPIPLRSMLRYALTGAFLKFTPFWKPLEKHTAHEWLRRYMGEEVYNMLFRPLLIGKFGDLYQEINMAFMWARVVKRSLKLGTFVGGFQAFLEALAEAITARGATIHLNTPVERIGTQDGKPTLTVKGETLGFDHVVSTTSPKLMLKLTDGLAETPYGDMVSKLKSIGSLCVVIAIKHQLLEDGTYWLNLPASTSDRDKNEFPFLAMVEHTNWMSRENYGGDRIIYCGDYLPPDHEHFQISEEELFERYLPALKKVNPDFSRDWVRKWWVWRAPYAQPVPGINHSAMIPPLQTPIPGVIWASMSQVYPWDRGTNYSVEMAQKVAEMVMGQENK